MKMFLIVLSVVSFAHTSYGGIFTPIESASGDFCKDQVMDIMSELFGEDVEVTKIQSHMIGEQSQKQKVFILKTNLCDGTFHASTIGMAPCKDAHYVFVPDYIKQVYATGSCKELLESPIYP